MHIGDSGIHAELLTQISGCHMLPSGIAVFFREGLACVRNMMLNPFLCSCCNSTDLLSGY